MNDLHPLVVHFPVALTILWPIVDAVGLATRRPDVSKVALALLVLAAVSALVASVTGQSAFDAASDQGVPRTLLETHASPANLLPWALFVTVAGRTYGVLKLGAMGHRLAVAFGFALFALVYTVGHTGGALVFEHGVGVARPAPAAGAGATASPTGSPINSGSASVEAGGATR